MSLLGYFYVRLTSAIFILEASAAFFPNATQTTSTQPDPIRKEQIYVTQRSLLRNDGAREW